MDTVHALIFGIVEGLTEFLPISSTGHLILTARILGLSQTDFLKSFEIAIQSGAILAVVVLYWKKLFVGMTFAFVSEMAGWLEDALRVVFSKRKLLEQGLFKPAGHPHRSNAKVM